MAARHERTAPVVTFLGGAGTVTGSRFLVETATARVLVDCGLYQGVKELRLRNWEPFPVAPESLDAVVLTHAHVDHCGYVPALAREGYAGPLVATPDTVSLAGIVLPDSGHLMEEEAAYANRRGYSKHRPARPLYTKAEAEASLALLEGLPFGEPRRIAEGVSLTLRPTGHILGAASALLQLGDGDGARRVLFSGDLGRSAHPLLVPPAAVGAVDVVVMESTYGDRLHDDEGALETLAAAIRRTAARGGTVVIPAFAVDRTEVVLFHLRELLARERIPELPVFVDSPMALSALGVYRRALAEGSPDVRSEVRPAAAGDVLGTGDVREARDVEHSKEIDRLDYPSIVISASGMATGGRVLHHLSRRLPDPRNTVVLVGFQAVQTRGRLLAEGAREVKMLGRYVPVRAEIVSLPSFSVHADRDELVGWLGTAAPAPEHVYLVHGEAAAAEKLAHTMLERLGWNVTVPRLGERVRLD
jgi:metallo-beta-lactamase family protein